MNHSELNPTPEERKETRQEHTQDPARLRSQTAVDAFRQRYANNRGYNGHNSLPAEDQQDLLAHVREDLTDTAPPSEQLDTLETVWPREDPRLNQMRRDALRALHEEVSGELTREKIDKANETTWRNLLTRDGIHAGINIIAIVKGEVGSQDSTSLDAAIHVVEEQLRDVKLSMDLGQVPNDSQLIEALRTTRDELFVRYDERIKLERSERNKHTQDMRIDHAREDVAAALSDGNVVRTIPRAEKEAMLSGQETTAQTSPEQNLPPTKRDTIPFEREHFSGSTVEEQQKLLSAYLPHLTDLLIKSAAEKQTTIIGNTVSIVGNSIAEGTAGGALWKLYAGHESAQGREPSLDTFRRTPFPEIAAIAGATINTETVPGWETARLAQEAQKKTPIETPASFIPGEQSPPLESTGETVKERIDREARERRERIAAKRQAEEIARQEVNAALKTTPEEPITPEVEPEKPESPKEASKIEESTITPDERKKQLAAELEKNKEREKRRALQAALQLINTVPPDVRQGILRTIPDANPHLLNPSVQTLAMLDPDKFDRTRFGATYTDWNQIIGRERPGDGFWDVVRSGGARGELGAISDRARDVLREVFIVLNEAQK